MPSQPNEVATQSTPAPSSPPPSPRPRCSHISRSGTPCRYSALPHSNFCKYHLPVVPAFLAGRTPTELAPARSCGGSSDRRRATAADPDPALAAELLEAAGEFSTPSDVNRVMRAVYRAMVERRLSPKEAGVLCYIAQTTLHSQRAMDRHQQLEAEAQARREGDEDNDSPPMLTWNLPPNDWIHNHPQEYAAILKKMESTRKLPNEEPPASFPRQVPDQFLDVGEE